MSKNNYINILLISGSGLIAGGLNYIYHPIMLKFLTIEEFGIFGSLVGIFNILSILIIGIVLFLNKEISKNVNNKEKVKYIFIESTKILFFVSLIFYFIYFFLSPFIASFLQIEVPGIVLLVGLTIIISLLGTSINSTLRGTKEFKFLGIQTIIAPFFKLIFGFLLVFLGFHLYGAIAGFLIGGTVGVLVGITYLLHYFREYKKVGTTKELLSDFYKEKKKIMHFFFVSFFFAIFMNIDVIFAKNMFDETTAGIYAGVSVLGKFLIFLLLSIETVYYGQIMEYTKKKVPVHLIRNPILLVGITGVAALIVNFFIGGFILGILKKELADYTNIYLLTLVFYSLLAFISFFTKVLVGWGKYYINYVMGFLTLFLFFIVYTFGKDSLEQFVYSFIGVGGIGTIIISSIFFYEYKKMNK